MVKRGILLISDHRDWEPDGAHCERAVRPCVQGAAGGCSLYAQPVPLRAAAEDQLPGPLRLETSHEGSFDAANRHGLWALVLPQVDQIMVSMFSQRTQISGVQLASVVCIITKFTALQSPFCFVQFVEGCQMTRPLTISHPHAGNTCLQEGSFWCPMSHPPKVMAPLLVPHGDHSGIFFMWKELTTMWWWTQVPRGRGYLLDTFCWTCPNDYKKCRPPNNFVAVFCIWWFRFWRVPLMTCWSWRRQPCATCCWNSLLAKR